ncbi:hypothetical protein [Aquicoccus sp. SU-CL01552]|uniref:hypothetical protein n=1 Tax=Aquicoccus sp. SU-CL01552 TaxID=3127656 RepID=UPI0031056E27
MAGGALEQLAGKLADDTIAAMDESGDDRLYTEVGEVLAASSQSLEEAFLTEIRVRLAERKARRFLNRRLAQLRAKAPAGGASNG